MSIASQTFLEDIISQQNPYSSSSNNVPASSSKILLGPKEQELCQTCQLGLRATCSIVLCILTIMVSVTVPISYEKNFFGEGYVTVQEREAANLRECKGYAWEEGLEGGKRRGKLFNHDIISILFLF